jgi:hypothetical protein
MTSSNINLHEFCEDDFYDFSKDTILIGKLFKKSNIELKKIKQEKEYLILQLSESHASNSELDSIDIKPMIEDTTCLDNSCLTNHMMPNSNESGIQCKFIPKCHNCGKIGHIWPNCYLLKSHRPWIKQDALWKSKVEDSSSSKYVPPHRRHIKGKGNIVCKNANHISAEKVKHHSNKRSLPTCHHCGITGHIRPKCPHLQAQKSKVQNELPTKATSGTLPPTAFQAPRHQQ